MNAEIKVKYQYGLTVFFDQSEHWKCDILIHLLGL